MFETWFCKAKCLLPTVFASLLWFQKHRTWKVYITHLNKLKLSLWKPFRWDRETKSPGLLYGHFSPQKSKTSGKMQGGNNCFTRFFNRSKQFWFYTQLVFIWLQSTNGHRWFSSFQKDSCIGDSLKLSLKLFGLNKFF